MTFLKQLRENQGRDPKEIARIAGIGESEYFDLEDHEDEIDNAQSVLNVARVARALGVKPSKLYGGASSRAISVEDLASMVNEHLRRTGKPLADFENQIGWSIGGALTDPREFHQFNADGLRAVSDALGISWFDVLDTLA